MENAPAPSPTSAPVDRRFLIGGLAGAAGVAALAAIARGGPLNPPAGPVTSTGKTLSSVEPRIDLLAAVGTAAVSTNASNDFIINTAGSYYLSANFTATKPTAILINVPDVTLDLNGFELQRTSGTGDGIALAASADGVMIINGSIRGFITGVNGQSANPFPRGCTFRSLRIRSCANAGLGAGYAAIVENCSVIGCGMGFMALDRSVISNCTVDTCNGAYGIFAGATVTISGCSVTNVSGGNGIQTDTGCTLINCAVSHCGPTRGITAGNGSTLTNCSSNSSTVAYGIEAKVGCTLIACVASSNTNNAALSGGFLLGNNCTAVQCSAIGNESTGSLTDDTGVGFRCGGGSTLESCTASNNRGMGIITNYSVVRQCTANNNARSGMYGSQRTSFIECVACGNTISGIRAEFAGIIRGCLTAQNTSHGIVAEGGGGIDIVGNVSEENGNNATAQGAGIRINGSFCRVQDNHSYVNWRGIEVPSVVGVAIVRNFAAANSSANYAIASGNKVGIIVSSPASGAINGSTGGAGMGSTDPNANFSY